MAKEHYTNASEADIATLLEDSRIHASIRAGARKALARARLRWLLEDAYQEGLAEFWLRHREARNLYPFAFTCGKNAGHRLVKGRIVEERTASEMAEMAKLDAPQAPLRPEHVESLKEFLAALKPHQLQVLAYARRGLRLREIAQRMKTSHTTVGLWLREVVQIWIQMARNPEPPPPTSPSGTKGNKRNKSNERSVAETQRAQLFEKILADLMYLPAIAEAFGYPEAFASLLTNNIGHKGRNADRPAAWSTPSVPGSSNFPRAERAVVLVQSGSGKTFSLFALALLLCDQAREGERHLEEAVSQASELLLPEIIYLRHNIELAAMLSDRKQSTAHFESPSKTQSLLSTAFIRRLLRSGGKDAGTAEDLVQDTLDRTLPQVMSRPKRPSRALSRRKARRKDNAIARPSARHARHIKEQACEQTDRSLELSREPTGKATLMRNRHGHGDTPPGTRSLKVQPELSFWEIPLLPAFREVLEHLPEETEAIAAVIARRESSHSLPC